MLDEDILYELIRSTVVHMPLEIRVTWGKKSIINRDVEKLAITISPKTKMALSGVMVIATLCLLVVPEPDARIVEAQCVGTI